MQPFTFSNANDVRNAIDLLRSSPKAKLIGGGTNLIDLMKMNVEKPDRLIDINSLQEQKIELLPNGGIRIGALVRNSDLAYHPQISSRYPVLSQALLSGASPQLRNMATTGGNLMQRTRCPYFFDISFPCNKRLPGSGCSAIDGFNRMHAILGTSDKCIATHPSDLCVALVALDAMIHIEGPSGKRSVPVTDFHLVPAQTPEKETVLGNNEIITAVELPGIPYATRSVYLKIRDRASYEFALVSAAVILDINNNMIRTARIALGGVGTKPWRCYEAEKILAGKSFSEKVYAMAADAALEKAKAYKYNSFKIELAKRTLIRALTIAGGMS